MKNKDYVNTIINNIKIINYYCTKDSCHRPYFECICECGNIFSSRVENIKSGITKSCGCKTNKLIAIAHTLEDNMAAINIVFRNYKNTAKRKELEFSLSVDEFKKIIFDKCIYCGSPPQQSKFSGESKKNKKDMFLSYNRIDRINNNIGYIKENCKSCCHMCNAAKSDHSLEEFKKWIKNLIEFNNGK
jgi:hypothetical protein